jgi:CSLREA domain-containing protein
MLLTGESRKILRPFREENMYKRIPGLLFGAIIAGMIATMLFALPMPASSAPASTFDVNVTTTADEFSGSDCSLREAIESVNINNDVAGCFRLIYNATNPPMSWYLRAPIP